MSEDLAAYYDTYWTGSGFAPPPNGNRFLTEQIARFGMPGQTVADLGCGDARTVGDHLSAAGATYVGVDISESAVRAATGRGLDVRRVDDITTTGLQSGGFDAVFMVEVLEHLLDPLAAAREARRLLKPGGTLVVTCPNAAVWIRRFELLFMGRPNAMGDGLSRSEPWRDPHIRSFTVRSLRDLLSLAGFADVQVAGTEPQTVPEVVARWRPSLLARRCAALAVA